MDAKTAVETRESDPSLVYLFSSHGYDVYGDAEDSQPVSSDGVRQLTGCLRYYLDGKGEFKAVSLMEYEWLWKELNRLYPSDEEE